MHKDLILIGQLNKELNREFKEISFNDISSYENSTCYARSKDGAVIGLNFYGLGIIHFPQVITKFEKLEVLNFNNNPVKSIPKSFGKLKNLKRLSISNTKITDFSFLQNLKQLESLSIRENAIKDIEDLEFLKQLNQLQRLNLRNNKIENLPPWLFNLSLEVGINKPINIKGNPIDRPSLDIIKKGKVAIEHFFQKYLWVKSFLCHASPDKEKVTEIYQELKKHKVDVWFDKENLVPGDKYDEEIKSAIVSAEAFLICLSSKTSNAQYVHKELKQALEIAQKKSFSSNFIIPVRLEPVELPKELKGYHYANYYEKDGINQIIRALLKIIKDRNRPN